MKYENNCLVFDNGSYKMKIGIAGDDYPSKLFRINDETIKRGIIKDWDYHQKNFGLFFPQSE